MDAAIWVFGWTAYVAWAWRKTAGRRVHRSFTAPTSHVRPLGAIRRCASCLQHRPTVDVTDGFGRHPLHVCHVCLEEPA